MSAADNNSTRKLGVSYFYKQDGSRWVLIELLKYGPPYPKLVPSFRDLHRIVQSMAVCEDEKYPPPAKGRGRLAEFLRDAVYLADFTAIQRKYKIPERSGDTVVNAHGAKLAELPGAIDVRWPTVDQIFGGGSIARDPGQEG